MNTSACTTISGAALGGYDSIIDASRRMGHLSDTTYEPDPARQATYDTLYWEYLRLHDLFGRRGDDVMRNLKRIQREAIENRTRIPAAR